MVLNNHALLAVTLFVYCAGVPVRKPVNDADTFATDFFEDFNSLFGYNWWGTDSKEPSETVKEVEKPKQKNEIDAMIEDVLQFTERPNILSRSGDKPPESTLPPQGQSLSSAPLPQHANANLHTDSLPSSQHQTSQTPVYSTENNKNEQAHPTPAHAPGPLPWHGPHLQSVPGSAAQQPIHAQYPPYPYPSQQGIHPYPHPAGNSFFYPPAFVQTPYGIQPVPSSPKEETVSDSEVNTSPFDNSAPKSADATPQLPIVPQYPYYYLPPLPYHHQLPSNSDSSLDSFMSQPPVGPAEDQQAGSLRPSVPKVGVSDSGSRSLPNDTPNPADAPSQLPLSPQYPYYYYPPLPYHHKMPINSDSSLDSFMSQPPVGHAAAEQHLGPIQPTGIFEPPTRMFLDPSMDTYMVQGSNKPTHGKDDEDAAPTARSYGSSGSARAGTVKDEVTLQTMIDEKKAADAKFKEKYEVSVEKSTDAPQPRMKDSRPRESSELLVRSPLDYSSLTTSITTPQPAVEDVVQVWDNAEEISDEDENVSELDETTICQTKEGLIGSCSTPTECSMVSGLPSGSCTVPSVSGTLQCCLHTARCGQKSAQLVTYINNEQYPARTSSVPSCPISIALLPDICQVRLDFLHFDFKPPVGEMCDPSNSINLSTTPGGTIAHQPLCGHIADTGDHLSSSVPHLYAHYNRSHSPLPYHYHQLNMHIAVKDHPSAWNIRVAQIRCDLNPSGLTPLMATNSCSQWYTSSSAVMDSMILLSGSKNQFTACIKPDPEACAIRYHFYSVVCNKQDQVHILGSDISACGVTNDEWELVLPASNNMGLVVTPGREQDGGASSYTVGYTLIYECLGLQF